MTDNEVRVIARLGFLPTYEPLLQERLDAIEQAFPSVSTGSKYTRSGFHVYGLDNKPIDYIPRQHKAWHIQDKLGPITPPYRTVGCPFCGARVATDASEKVEEPFIIIGCPNVGPVEPASVDRWEGVLVCDWYDREERGKRAVARHPPIHNVVNNYSPSSENE